MQTALQHPSTAHDHNSLPKFTLFTRFMRWATRQETYHFGWIGAILALHGCVITPVTVLIIAFTGMNLALFITAMAAMGLALTTNLAAMPTKITIPAFFLSVLVDVAVIVACLV